MVSPPITPDDLSDLPDHTDMLESLDKRDAVDGILPRHLGNSELGRFVVSFTVVSGRTIQCHCLVDDDGEFQFRKKYEFQASDPVEVWSSLWEAEIAFHWPDHDDALAIRGTELAYGSYFTLGRPVPEFDDVKTWALKNLSITVEPEIPDCDHSQGSYEDVPNIPLEVRSCDQCGVPIYARYLEEIVGPWDTFLEEPWWEFSESTVVGGSDITFICKPSSTATTLTDVAVHLMSREAHAEWEPFDYYLGDYNAVVFKFEKDIVGYLTWNQHHGHTVLQSIYVRPDYRNRGLADQAIRTWYEQICPADSYYVSEPNDGGFAVFKSVGHLDSDDPAIPIRVHSSSDSIEGNPSPGQQRY